MRFSYIFWLPFNERNEKFQALDSFFAKLKLRDYSLLEKNIEVFWQDFGDSLEKFFFEDLFGKFSLREYFDSKNFVFGAHFIRKKLIQLVCGVSEYHHRWSISVGKTIPSQKGNFSRGILKIENFIELLFLRTKFFAFPFLKMWTSEISWLLWMKFFHFRAKRRKTVQIHEWGILNKSVSP